MAKGAWSLVLVLLAACSPNKPERTCVAFCNFVVVTQDQQVSPPAKKR